MKVMGGGGWGVGWDREGGRRANGGGTAQQTGQWGSMGPFGGADRRNTELSWPGQTKMIQPVVRHFL